MKKYILNKSGRFFKLLFFASLLVGLFTQCEIQDSFEYKPSPSNPKIEMSSWEFIQQRTDIMSMMQQAVTRAQMQSYYSENKGYTYMLTNDTGWQKYLKTNKYTSVADIPVNVLQNILKYHIVKATVNFSDKSITQADNPISYNTESGEIMYLSRSTNYQGMINKGTKKTWTIITSNLEATNGILHVVDDVLYLSI